MANYHKKSSPFDWDNVKPQLPINFGVDSNGEHYHPPSDKDRLIEIQRSGLSAIRRVRHGKPP